MKRTLGLLIFSMILVQGATGCNYADDRHVYTSTYMQPTTVYIVEEPSGETILNFPIPPNHKLVVDFDNESNSSEFFHQSQGPATTVSWALYDIDASPGLILRNRFSGTVLESGSREITGTPVIGSTIGDPVDPGAVPSDRTIEEIEQDIDDSEGLPEPTEDGEAEEAAE